MGRISEVYYAEVSSDDFDSIKAGEFYYLYNLLGIDKEIDAEYEKYELDQVQLRNKLIGDAYKNKEIFRHPKMNTTIFGISSLKQNPVLLVEY